MRPGFTTEIEYIFERLHESIADEKERNYWQGRLDSMAWVTRQLNKEEM
jgi:hypothetical protein